jgi:uncharacterized RDD family membrane protein YckC
MTKQQPLHTSLQDAEEVPDLWRNEVQARLERYKRRRDRRIEGAFTMRFPFPTEEPAAVAQEPCDVVLAAAIEEPGLTECLAEQQPEESPIAVDANDSASFEVSYPAEQARDAQQSAVGIQAIAAEQEPEPQTVAPFPEPEEEIDPIIEMPPRPRPRRKVIAFPSPVHMQQEAMRRLADPVQPEQLRILDVPEELQAIPATPFLEGLLDAPAAPAPASTRDTVDLPCAVVQSAKRLGAALIDAAAVMVGAAAFLAAASRFVSQELPPTKFVIAGGLTISVLLWASYQYLFLVYGGRTLGMKLTRTYLQTFKGRRLTFRQRQSRVMALCISVLSLGMGVLWSFVDVEGLCWHDRISQTFPALAEKS